MADASDLRRRWAALVDDLALAPASAAALGEDLLARWREPHRGYHGIDHLAAVLDALDELAVGAGDPSAEVRAAAWFHDAVYAGVAGEDEERSAVLAEQALAGAGCTPARIDAVAAMVRATAGHLDPSLDEPVDADTALLLDADLAILASPAAVYDAYAAGVRVEHAEMSDAAFAAGRGRVLRTLLDRPALFHTAAARARFDAPARANLSRELATLSGDDPGGG